MEAGMMEPSLRIRYYQRRHRLTIRQIAELREFSGIAVSDPAEKQMKLSTMSKVAELIRLSKLFKSHHLGFIPIKGPLLSWRLHNDVAVRYSNDLDILVKPEDLFRVIKVLKEDGYQTIHFDLPASGSKKKVIMKLNNQIGLIHQQKKIPVEVHWRLINLEVCPIARLDKLINQNTESVIIHNEAFSVFNKEFELVFLIIHGAIHKWSRLKWLHDIVAFSKDEQLDWDRVITISKEFHAEQLIYQAVMLAHRFWDLPQNITSRFLLEKSHLKPFLITYPLESIANNPDGTVEPGLKNVLRLIYGSIKYGLMIFPSMKYRYSFMKRLMFREKDMNVIKLPDFLTFMYFPLRPFLYVYSKLAPSNTRNRYPK